MGYLIVNADDFGLSAGVNAGVERAHRRGIVTSASLMVRQPAAEPAVELSRALTSLSVGLHFDLGEWSYRDGEWYPVVEFLNLEDASAVRNELRRQLDRFRALVGRDPTHLDSHQHVHLHSPVREMAAEIALELDRPLRHFHPAVRYCGDFYGQTRDGQTQPDALLPERLVELIERLPEGVTELACHPGLDAHLPTMYCHERRLEVETLCDPVVKAAVMRTTNLISFADLAAEEASR